MSEQEETSLKKLLNYVEELAPEKRQEIIDLATREISYFPAFISLGNDEERAVAALTHYFLSRNLLLDVVKDKVDNLNPGSTLEKLETHAEPDVNQEIGDYVTFQNDPEADKILERDKIGESHFELDVWFSDIEEIWGDTDVTGIVSELKNKLRNDSFVVFSSVTTPSNLYDKLQEKMEDEDVLINRIVKSDNPSFEDFSEIWAEIVYILKCTLRYYRHAFSYHQKNQEVEELLAAFDKALKEDEFLIFLERAESIEKAFKDSELLKDICFQYFNRVSPLAISSNDNPSNSPLTQFLKEVHDSCRAEYEMYLMKEIVQFQGATEQSIRKTQELTKELKKGRDFSQTRNKVRRLLKDIKDEIDDEKKQRGQWKNEIKVKVREFIKENVDYYINQFVNKAAFEDYIIPHVIIVNNYAEDSLGRSFFGVIDRTSVQDTSGKYVQIQWLQPSFANLEIRFFEPFYFVETTNDPRETRNPILIPVSDVEIPENITKENILDPLRLYFNNAELESLCLDLGVPFGDVDRGNHSLTTNEIFDYLKRRDRLVDLYKHIRELRPFLQ